MGEGTYLLTKTLGRKDLCEVFEKTFMVGAEKDRSEQGLPKNDVSLGGVKPEEKY